MKKREEEGESYEKNICFTRILTISKMAGEGRRDNKPSPASVTLVSEYQHARLLRSAVYALRESRAFLTVVLAYAYTL